MITAPNLDERRVRGVCAAEHQAVTLDQVLLVVAAAQLVVVLGVFGPRMPVLWQPRAAYGSIIVACVLGFVAALV